MVADTYGRGSSRASVTVRLTDPKAFAQFKSALEANPQLKVEATTTIDYFSKQSERMTQFTSQVLPLSAENACSQRGCSLFVRDQM